MTGLPESEGLFSVPTFTDEETGSGGLVDLGPRHTVGGTQDPAQLPLPFDAGAGRRPGAPPGVCVRTQQLHITGWEAWLLGCSPPRRAVCAAVGSGPGTTAPELWAPEKCPQGEKGTGIRAEGDRKPNRNRFPWALCV